MALRIDCGGSKSRFFFGSEVVEVPGDGRGVKDWCESSLTLGVRLHRDRIDFSAPVTVAIAGGRSATVRGEVLRVLRALGFHGRVVVVPDLYPPIFSTSSEEKLVYLAGTGSAAALYHQGEVDVSGGWGYDLGDGGSGSSLGLGLLRSWASAWEKGDRLLESQAVLKELLADVSPKGATVPELLRLGASSPSLAARFAPYALESAQRDSRARQELLNEISILVEKGLRLLQAQAPQAPAQEWEVLAWGGLFQNQLYREAFAEGLVRAGFIQYLRPEDEDLIQGFEVLEARVESLPEVLVDEGGTQLSPTEVPHPRSLELDQLSPLEWVDLWTKESMVSLGSLRLEREAIAEVIPWMVEALRAGGRIFYVGAGTSGRLGVLDSSESPPTFHVDADRIQGLIAGGSEALVRSQEGAEDQAPAAIEALHAKELSEKDLVIGLAASGKTPYVQGALEAARAKGARSVLLTSNPHVDEDCADKVIFLATGPELLTGSTRLFAGTATKLVLNAWSTAAWVALGKSFGNTMVDLMQTSEKLQDRAGRILDRFLPEDYSKDPVDLLELAGGRVKLALVMAHRDMDAEGAEALLDKHQGKLAAVIESLSKSGRWSIPPKSDSNDS